MNDTIEKPQEKVVNKQKIKDYLLDRLDEIPNYYRTDVHQITDNGYRVNIWSKTFNSENSQVATFKIEYSFFVRLCGTDDLITDPAI